MPLALLQADGMKKFSAHWIERGFMTITKTLLFIASLASGAALAQQAPTSSGEYYRDYQPEAIIRELKHDAIADDAIMIPMRDGVGLDTDVYRPKNVQGPLPTIFWKTPYNELEMKSGAALSYALAAVRRGYAFVVQNERGRYFSQGDWQILGHPQSDGYDTLTWIAKQAWSNGKVGTLGCSSSAEWQLALAGTHHPALAAMVPMSAGAGIGKVGRFQEQGNWYTGGVPRTLFFVWLYGVDNPLRAQLPPITDPAMHARVSRYNDLSVTKPKVEWTKQIRHLPVEENGRLVGIVSMRDVTGIFAALAPGSVSVEHEFDQLVRERRLARIEQGDLD